MQDELTPSRPDETWIQDYLAGRLSEAEAEEFEARCLADDMLGAELERALEIRAALTAAASPRDLPTDPADDAALRAYVSGTAREADAEALEARLFSDDRLAAELERVLEIRAAMKSSASKAQVRNRRVGGLVPLALAAGVAMLGAGFYWLQTPPQSTPLFRGTQQSLALEVEVSGNQVRAQWDAVPGAAGYELRLFERDGRLIRSMEFDTTAGVIDLGSTGSAGTPKAASVDVTALDAFGQSLIRSQRIVVADGAAD
jgi:anti-sigma factor RsiW